MPLPAYLHNSSDRTVTDFAILNITLRHTYIHILLNTYIHYIHTYIHTYIHRLHTYIHTHTHTLSLSPSHTHHNEFGAILKRNFETCSRFTLEILLYDVNNLPKKDHGFDVIHDYIMAGFRGFY